MRMTNLFGALGLDPGWASAKSPEAKPIQLKKSGQSLRIMLVDDCMATMCLIENRLLGHFPKARILKIPDGEQAWQQLVWQEPDLLISDLMRPGVHGLELLRRLAQRRVKFPVLILSGALADWEPEARRCAGPELKVSFLTKMILGENEFLTIVDRCLSHESEPTPNAAPVSFSAERPLRIIHVDDESAILQLLSVLMQKRFKHLELLQFQNSVTASHALARFNPDLLITDDRMPVLSGCDIVARLAERKAAFPIVVISASDQTEAWVKAFAARGLRISYLPAPFAIKTFMEHLSPPLGPLEPPPAIP